ncbi:MAG: PH domain-containing protein [Candidatus Aenigmarchaeota archaeon]|nr:PH domain-containing protein [Candidatus Aenigmarchaeota archaeon]
MAVDYLIWIIGIGTALEAITLLTYVILHGQVTRFENVKGKILHTAKRARRSYVVYYVMILIFGFLAYFSYSEPRAALIYVAIISFTILEIVHDSARIVLTDRQIVISKGFIVRKIALFYYKDISYVEVNETFGGRLLGYGDIKISLIDREFTFEKIGNPLKIKDIIETQKLAM